MKACVLEEVGKLIYKEVEKPVVKPGEVLVKIKAVGICSSDIPRVYKTGTYHFPTIPGHEIAGEIVELGEGVDLELIHKKAVIFPLLPCFECESCKEKQYARCDNYNYFGSRCDGGFAEYLAVPVWNIVTFEDDVDYKTAALCEPTAVALHAVESGTIENEDTVLVIGSGAIGYLTALWAKEKGAKRVVIACRSQQKADFAKELDLEAIVIKEDYVAQLKEILGIMPNVVIECVGSNNAIQMALECTRKGGRIVCVGNPEGDIVLSQKIYWKILRNELKVIGTWNSSYSDIINNWKEVIHVMNGHTVPFEKLITHVFPLSQKDEAFNVLRNKTEFAIKVMFVLDETHH